jgi:hypothetical protein
MASTGQNVPCVSPESPAISTASQNPDSNETFKRLWKHSTEDNNLTLYGFRRFKTTHLLNLRYLEEEIFRLDNDIYNAGLRSGRELGVRDRLGLRYSKTDPSALQDDEIMNREMILRLRNLLKGYSESPENVVELYD